MNKQKGLSLYLSIIITVILLSMVLGISTILLSQLKTIKGMENSVVAFYAADTGIEKVLVDRADPTGLDGYSETLDDGITYYEITILDSSDPDCDANTFCIRSVGDYKGVKRAIEVEY